MLCTSSIDYHVVPMLVGTRATVHRGPALRRRCLHHNLTTWILHFDKQKIKKYKLYNSNKHFHSSDNNIDVAGQPVLILISIL